MRKFVWWLSCVSVGVIVCKFVMGLLVVGLMVVMMWRIFMWWLEMVFGCGFLEVVCRVGGMC